MSARSAASRAEEIYKNLTEAPEPIVIDGVEIVNLDTVVRMRIAARLAELPATVSETATGIVGLVRFAELMRLSFDELLDLAEEQERRA